MLDGIHARQRRRISAQMAPEIPQHRRIPPSLDTDAIAIVPYPPADAEAPGQVPDEGAETHALHLPAYTQQFRH